MQNANLVGDLYQSINRIEWGLSRAEILQISHNAMGQNCATWLISRTCLSKMSYSSSFLGILTPHVVLKDLVCFICCSARNCAAPINVVGKSKSASETY